MEKRSPAPEASAWPPCPACGGELVVSVDRVAAHRALCRRCHNVGPAGATDQEAVRRLFEFDRQRRR